MIGNLNLQPRISRICFDEEESGGGIVRITQDELLQLSSSSSFNNSSEQGGSSKVAQLKEVACLAGTVVLATIIPKVLPR